VLTEVERLQVRFTGARPRGVWTASRSTPTDWWLSNGGMYHSVVNLFRACPGYVSKTLCSIATSYTGR